MDKRDREEGWKWAKITGHSNEEAAKNYVENSSEIQKRILKCYGEQFAKIVKVDIGGLNEHDIDSVFGDKTKSKPDMRIFLDDGRAIKISIKKSTAGQVFLITPERFIKGYELIYGEIPDIVKKGIGLFFGSDSETISIAKQFSGPFLKYELRKGRLVHDTIRKYNADIDNALLAWFKDHVTELFEFCFIRGLAKHESDCADIIWYVNLVDEGVCIDKLFNANKLKQSIKNTMVSFGNRGGGTTIILPFGFVQWHDPGNKGNKNLQFHHKFELLEQI